MLGKMIPPMPGLMEVLRPTRTPDGQGGFVRSYEVGSTVRGRIRPLRVTERLMAGRETVPTTHLAYLPPDTDIHAEDRVRYAGQDYRVTGVLKPGGTEHHLTAMLLEID